MKILAIEQEIPGVSAGQFTERVKRNEAARVWELIQADVLREIYFRQDWPGAVLILECAGTHAARDLLDTLPMVQQGLITFEIIPLKPYPGLGRLFAETP